MWEPCRIVLKSQVRPAGVLILTLHNPALAQKVSSGYLECVHNVYNMSCSAVSQTPHLSGSGPQMDC